MDKSVPITAQFGTQPHQLKLGKSFNRDKHSAFHTIRYDFKPASVDDSKEALLEVKEGQEVNITLPNVESKGTTCTKFKGSKRPVQKECILIYDHRTGEFTLERLTCTMQVKKQREEGTSKSLQSRPLAGVDSSANPKNSPNVTSGSSKTKKSGLSASNAVLAAPDFEQGGEISPLQPSPLAPSPHTPPSHQASQHDDSSDSSSSYTTDSDSDGGDNDRAKSSGSSSSDDDDRPHDSQGLRNGGNWKHPTKPTSPPKPNTLDVSHFSAQYLKSQLSQDLQLSDSDSD